MAAPRVLIIDDEPETVSMLKLFLELFGFEVMGTHTGKAGMKAIDEYKPHALILDLMLPDADGYQICRTLRDAPETRRLPIIMLSARTSQSDVKRGYKMGATRYLKKPVDLDLLVSELRNVIEAATHAPPTVERQKKDAISPPTGADDG